MKKKKFFIPLMAGLFLLTPLAAVSGDFDWMKEMAIQAQADPSGFRLKLSARFNLGDAQVSAILGQVDDPAEAYMVLRMGEMVGKPPEVVLTRYKKEKKKGWGALAQSLGVKPGSQEFHDLKGRSSINEERGKRGKEKGGKNRERKDKRDN